MLKMDKLPKPPTPRIAKEGREPMPPPKSKLYPPKPKQPYIIDWLLIIIIVNIVWPILLLLFFYK